MIKNGKYLKKKKILYVVRLEPTISTLTAIRSIQMAKRDKDEYRIRKYLTLKSILFIMFANLKLVLLCFQRCIVMRLFYFSYKQVKHEFSLLRAYAIICGRFNITVNWDYLHAQNQGKLASACLHRFSSIFESTIRSYTSLYGIFMSASLR